ncbi:hypothetical protein EJV47_05650 [Hymenobacter gummosus]|uniref:Outer membrane protein beta-barrel domain-containing protein n=1 Tax=Hymenobacter gummosus TaxID=1776032 RepID=A0A3S0H7U6_9BACT|nr:hypothetical protein [Hymenobacter gummosus]RTQ52496.1 hypothetical protein EJV47_05650 [Hymenobacter gummosus]
MAQPLQAQKFHFAITGGPGVVFNHKRTSGPITAGTYLDPLARSNVGVVLGVRLRYPLGRQWFVDLAPGLAQYHTDHTLYERMWSPGHSGLPSLVAKSTWEKVTRELLLPVGLNRVVRCNDALWVQGILRPYVGVDTYWDEKASDVTVFLEPGVRLTAADPYQESNGGRIVAGLQGGIGLMLPRRLLEITLLYTRPQTPERYYLESTYSYRDADGSAHTASHQTRLRVRPDMLQAQLAVYMK